MGDGEGKRGDGSGSKWSGVHSILRRKQVDSLHSQGSTHQQLAKELSVIQLVAIGVGSTIGAGVYVLVGTVAREHTGPALTISFLIAGVAAALSAFCYAELASRCPSAGSAYHYSYICVGEGVAWLIGWALILEYTIGGSAVARGISPNLALFFGGSGSLPSFLARQEIPWLDIVVDPCAAILVLIVTALLCFGIKEVLSLKSFSLSFQKINFPYVLIQSMFVQSIITTANACVMIFVIIAGGYIGFQTGWVGYSVASGYFPFGVNGMLSGSATVFFAFIGFDSVASTAEEVKNPQRDLPLGIGISLSICCLLYMMVSVVVVGLVPYFAMDPDTPISSVFARNGMQWAAYVVTAGAILALCSTLMGSILPQPRILMAMARDGLLPPFFSEVNRQTQVPVKSTLLTGICAASLAFCMDVSQLAGMVSVGTLFAFTIVAISILILRYTPPVEVPLPSSLQVSIESVSFRYNSIKQERGDGNSTDFEASNELEGCAERPLMVKEMEQDGSNEKIRRSRAAWSIAMVCIGVVILISSASATFLPSIVRYATCVIGGAMLLSGLAVLSWIDQDDAHHTFGHTGGFICPFIPFLPVCCILTNAYLLINLGVGTWMRVSIWLLGGVFVYVFYGRTHSVLTNAVYVPSSHADEIYKASSEYVS